MNSEPELITKDEDEDEFDCKACDTVFDKAGKIVRVFEEPKKKPVTKRT